MEAHAASTDVLSLGHDHFQLASSVVNITAKGFMHTTNCFFFGNKNLKQSHRPVVVVRVVTHNRGNYCIERLGVLHPSRAKQDALLEEGWASPMQIYIVRATAPELV
jgi:hypothetical protein